MMWSPVKCLHSFYFPVCILLGTKPEKDTTSNLQTNIPYVKKHKNSQPNTSKTNSVTHQKD